jgi:hypothetical protein
MAKAELTRFALILTVFGMTACNNTSRENNAQNQNEFADTLFTGAVTDNDTITYDNYSYPVDSSFTTKVLAAGIFHGDEVWEHANKENWFGLFKGTTGFYIAETKLKTKRVHDPIVDEKESDKTGWEVRTLNHDTVLILIEKLEYLAPRNVQPAALTKEHVFPGDTLRIHYLGVDYKIYATGGKKEDPDNPGWLEVWNYKLFLAATIDGIPCKSLLVAQPNFDDKMITLLFAGDMDGDGIMDLLIDTSRHYNSTIPTLYLSKPSGKGEVVKPIGGHTSVGC